MSMKIDRLDAHDRLLSFTNQNFEIPDCMDHLIKSEPFGKHPFYIFCHPRTDDDGVTKRYIYSPWIWKPRAQTNSALYKAYPGTDIIKVIWIIPPREMWNVYQRGNLFENPIIGESIYQFDFDKDKLEKPEDDDPTPERAQEIAFEYQPQLFKRETLPKELQPIWDRRMAERSQLKAKQRNEVSSQVVS
jgi:hypothetical protein